MPNPHASHYPNIGDLGEDLVARWLQSRGWEILHRQFRCRWGEIDIIAQYQGSNDVVEPNHYTQLSTLAFVEVKTRSLSSWDAGGRNAITQAKKLKLWRTAELYLAQYPDKADYPCRFDVALVQYQKRKNILSSQLSGDRHPHINQIKSAGQNSDSMYELTLQEYIPAAFEA
jgi:putative endonuclease